MTLSALYTVRVTCTAFQALGLLLTAWRIYIRLRIRRFWWEDAWAAMLLFIGLVWLIVQWVFLFTDGLASAINTWIFSIGFTCIVTLVRMSVLFSIIRIIHRKFHLLQFTSACVVFFAVCWVIIIIQKIVNCSTPSWQYQKLEPGAEKPFCVMNMSTSIFQVTTDCIAVLILVVLPLRMLWRVKLPRRQRRMILSIFASSIFLAFGALFHAIGQILNVYMVMVAGINVEVALALILCNLLVFVTHTYRLLSRSDGTTTEDTSESTSDDDDFTTRLPLPVETQTTAHNLTTVDLDISIPIDYEITKMTDHTSVSRVQSESLSPK